MPETWRMKSDQVRVDWKNVLLHIRAGGTVTVEHYKDVVARIIPADDSIIVVRAADPVQAGRLRRLIAEHGAVGLPFPNNVGGLRVVDGRGKLVHPHSIPSVEVEVLDA